MIKKKKATKRPAKKRAAKRKRPARPRKKKVGATYVVAHELERVGATIPQTRAHLRRELESAMKHDLYRREMATNKTERSKASKAIAEKKREIKAIGGVKKRKARKRRK